MINIIILNSISESLMLTDHAAHRWADTAGLVFPSNCLMPGRGRPASPSPPAPRMLFPLISNRKPQLCCLMSPEAGAIDKIMLSLTPIVC